MIIFNAPNVGKVIYPRLILENLQVSVSYTHRRNTMSLKAGLDRYNAIVREGEDMEADAKYESTQEEFIR